MAIDEVRATLPTAGSLVRLDWRSGRVRRVSGRVSDTGTIGGGRTEEPPSRALGQSGRHSCKRRNGN